MIDLEQILMKHSFTNNGRIVEQKGWVIEAMKEACEICIDLCAEKVKHGCTPNEKEVPKGEYFNLFPLYYFLDKNSILYIKDLIK
jgi:hypothetical protein